MKGSEITFFCGNKRRDELPLILSENNMNMREVECYQTQLTSRKIEEKIKGIMFYSPSGIESYLKTNSAFDKVAFCIGATTAAEAKKYFKEVTVAEVPTVESVIHAVNACYQVK